MRRDSIAADAFEYKPSEDVEICGVPIPAGTVIGYDLITPKFDENHFLQPYDFIPERHDFESEFYKKSKEAGKLPDVYSIRYFGHGKRNCPGQTLALLEMKIFVAYVVTHLEIEFNQKDLQKEGIGFGMGCQEYPIVKLR